MKFFRNAGLAFFALALSGCTTFEQSNAAGPTYSGAARAAVSNQIASASTYVRGLFTKPLPAWQPANTGVISVQQPPAVQPDVPASRDPADDVQTHPVDLGGR